MKNEKKSLNPTELRTFGLSVGIVFGLIALYPLFKGESIRAWAAIIGTSLIAPAIFFPPLLELPFKAWQVIGHALGWLNTRIILSVLYFAAIVPVSLVLKIFGREPLKLHFDPEASSYREMPENKTGSSLKNQF
ncbi:MAG: SxtJ family membrane protein [Candidatus Rifleibacteriota bacterium]